jgi:hypothetical protein
LTAQNAPIWTATLVIGIQCAAAQIGGSRAMSAASDHHAARPTLQCASEPSDASMFVKAFFGRDFGGFAGCC